MASSALVALVLCATVLQCLAMRPNPGETLKMVVSGAGGLVTTGADDGALVKTFKDLAAKHKKIYTSKDEEETRFAAFLSNWVTIERANSANSGYTLELNEFFDMSWDEFRMNKLGASQDCSATESNHLMTTSTPLPAKKDWRAEGVVSPVKNQGRCGSCWTFSTTGALEAAYKQAHGVDVSLSEQQLVDCASDFNNNGCNGGLPSQAFEYVKYTGGLDTETSYPYFAKNGECHFHPNAVGVKVVDVVNITQFDEEGLKDAVAFARPVSIAFEVVDDFRFYKTGVYSSPKCKSGPDTVNHAVLAVGYDSSAPQPYWIVKNSWGSDWGDNGYFKIKMGVNMCGLAACASYPVVA